MLRQRKETEYRKGVPDREKHGRIGGRLISEGKSAITNEDSRSE